MSKTVLIVLAVLGGSCALCGGGVMLLGLVSEADAPGAAQPGPGGEHPAELVGFWDNGSQKMALFPDGTAKRWYRHHWNGQYGGDSCKLEGDLEGTWSAEGQQLTVEMTEGRWRSCRGEEAFSAVTDVYSWRQEFASGIGKQVMWLENAKGKDGYNLECERPDGCSFQPAPLP
jgi:hypothetical protein